MTPAPIWKTRTGPPTRLVPVMIFGQSVTSHVAGSNVHSVANCRIWSGGADVAKAGVIGVEAGELREAAAGETQTHARAGRRRALPR